MERARVDLAVGELLATVASLADQTGAFEHGDVLLHRGERHVVADERRRPLRTIERYAQSQFRRAKDGTCARGDPLSCVWNVRPSLS